MVVQPVRDVAQARLEHGRVLGQYLERRVPCLAVSVAEERRDGGDVRHDERGRLSAQDCHHALAHLVKG